MICTSGNSRRRFVSASVSSATSSTLNSAESSLTISTPPASCRGSRPTAKIRHAAFSSSEQAEDRAAVINANRHRKKQGSAGILALPMIMDVLRLMDAAAPHGAVRRLLWFITQLAGSARRRCLPPQTAGTARRVIAYLPLSHSTATRCDRSIGSSATRDSARTTISRPTRSLVGGDRTRPRLRQAGDLPLSAVPRPQARRACRLREVRDLPASGIMPLKHPVNLAYEAATADLKDVNMIDPFHLEAYGNDLRSIITVILKPSPLSAQF